MLSLPFVVLLHVILKNNLWIFACNNCHIDWKSFYPLRAMQVSAPLLILHGAADKVTDPLVSQFLYEKASSKDKTLKIYEGGYHGILEGEPDDRIFAVHNDIISWLDFRCSLE